jgi:hypothetical protein
MKVSIEVSGITLELGMALDELLLSSYGFKKMGFITRSILPIPKKRGDVIFISKNPTINIFKSAAQVGTGLESSMGLGMTSKTSCIAMFNGNRLRYVICQVIENNMGAHQFSKDIREAALTTFGEPTRSDGPQMWQEGDETFAFEIGSGGRSTVIHWWTE